MEKWENPLGGKENEFTSNLSKFITYPHPVGNEPSGKTYTQKSFPHSTRVVDCFVRSLRGATRRGNFNFKKVRDITKRS